MAKNIVFILLSAISLFSNMAFADPALVIKSDGCFLFDGNGVLTFVPTGDQHAVITSLGMIERLIDDPYYECRCLFF